MALEKIRDVQRRVAQLDALSRRTDGSLRRGPLSKRCETALAEPFDAPTHPDLVRERETLARELAELEAILDEHFRVAASGQQAVVPPSREASTDAQGYA